MPNPPVWSLSHWYMWVPLWLLIIAPGLFFIGKLIKNEYMERRSRDLDKLIDEYEKRESSHD